MTNKTYTTEELQVYTTIVLRYYNYYQQSMFKDRYLNDHDIQEFGEWYNKFIFDADLRTKVKEHNQLKHEEESI